MAKKLTAHEVYENLREMIMSFELYPGSRITETELAEHFCVSRTPVREALQRLEQEGYLTVRPKQGCFIRDLDVGALSEYYEVRIALEMASVETACSHMPTKDLEALAEQWDPSTQPKRIASAAMEERDEAFHLALAAGSGNMALVKYLRDINNHIRVIRRVDFDNSERIARTYREHFDIVQSLLQRDVDKARSLIRRHIVRSEEFAKTLTLTQLARKKGLASRFARR